MIDEIGNIIVVEAVCTMWSKVLQSVSVGRSSRTFWRIWENVQKEHLSIVIQIRQAITSLVIVDGLQSLNKGLIKRGSYGRRAPVKL